ncbi:hypothetical protein [Nodularia sp. NIES-3585]|nr:hypothetical protein [Nodularia sp. NIES-3585]
MPILSATNLLSRDLRHCPLLLPWVYSPILRVSDGQRKPRLRRSRLLFN